MEQDKNDRISELFNQARNEKPKISFETTQQQFLKSAGGSTSLLGRKIITKLLTVKSIIISVLVISVLAISGMLLFGDNVIEEKPLNLTEDKIVEEQITTIVNDDEITVVENTEHHAEKITKTLFVESNLSSKKEVLPQKSIISKKAPISKTKKSEEPFVFPVFTAKEIKANNKQKLIMLKYLARYKRMPAHNNIDDRKYPMIYWNEIVKEGKVMGIDATDAFYMQNTEVSVLEYRTFLFDLLIQGRKDDFLIAKPDQEQWVKAFKVNFNEPMVQNYFSHPAYNEYPINNISRKGAEMYCEWLTVERNKLDPEKYGLLFNSVRLPTAKEWIQAASNRGKKIIYPWGNDEKGCDSCYFANYQPIKGNFIADGGFHTVKVNSYNANAKMYCMSGNVAEMVTYEDGTIGALGGSWTSLPDEIKINAPDKYKGVSTPNVNIGFRPVISYLGTSNKKLDSNATKFCFPVLTYREIKENNDRKVKMFGKIKTPKKPKKKETENIGKTGREEWFQPDPFGYLFIPMGSMNIDDEEISLQAFYMKQTEVSNIEYRTFLLDLLINNRRDEFLLAKPDQLVWDNAIDVNDSIRLAQNYFSEEKYDNYPVVGVSRKGAEMYCQWLNEEYEKRNTGAPLNKFRIPTDVEWMYAASGGNKQFPYPWDGNDFTNSEGFHLANYKPKRPESYRKEGEEFHEYCYICDGALYTAPVASYNPNDFGLYCMSGNVAEMVVKKGNVAGTKGGSFTSIGQELQIIEGKDRFEGVISPNVNIGFRPVMTYLGRGKE